MKKYEILEHKADLKIRVFGETKEGLFLNALFGMQDYMKSELKKPEEKAEREIKIKSPDSPALLVDFLSEALYLIQVNREVYFEAKFKKFTDTSHQNKFGAGRAELEAELSGQKVERFNEDIKAVTYHQLDVHQGKDRIWEATVLFDI